MVLDMFCRQGCDCDAPVILLLSYIAAALVLACHACSCGRPKAAVGIDPMLLLG